jgi:hypothetical protein
MKDMLGSVSWSPDYKGRTTGVLMVPEGSMKAMRDEIERLRAALKRIDEFVNDKHRPLGDARFERLAAMTREALK